METSFDLTLKNLDDTFNFGKTLSRFLSRGAVIALTGELGAGKTTLVKAIAAGMGIPKNEVCSPSYTLMNEYAGRLPLYHFDLYRLEGAEDIHSLGYEEYLEGDGISVVEWADIAPDLLPGEYLEVRIEISGEEERKLSITGVGERFVNLGAKLKKKLRGNSLCLTISAS